MINGMENSIYELKKNDFLSISPNFKAFQYEILQRWLSKGIFSFDEITNLPKQLIDILKDRYTSPLSSHVIKDDNDLSSTKLLISLKDSNTVECVLLHSENNTLTACVSSEVGCSMKCEFCATGTIGFKRKLMWYEIVEQFFHLKKLQGKIDRIVFMGMGEPLCNFDNVKKAIEYFKNDIGMSPRRITVSTSGIVPGIKKLADSNLGVKLALSLVSSNNEIRRSLMSAARLYNLNDLKKALVYYSKKENRRLALEYCLLSNVNMDKKSAEELKEFTKGLVVSINLIPWNTLPYLPFKTPNEKEIKNFENMLDKLKIPHTTRVSRGRKTSAACGMLVATAKNLSRPSDSN